MTALSFTTRSASSRIRYRGFTLVEMAISMGVSSLIMVAVGSALLFAVKAMPQTDSPTQVGIRAGEIAGEFVTELQYAVTINTYSPRLVEFTVADRDGDEVPELIRWEWTGTSGAPLTRQYNGGNPITQLEDVETFDLSYGLQALSREVTPDDESGERLLLGYLPTENLGAPDVDRDEWLGQYFFPSLPHNTLSWRVTRVAFLAKISEYPLHVAKVQIRQASDQRTPGTTVLAEQSMYEWTLGHNFLKREFSFANLSGLPPEEGLCLVLTGAAYYGACRVQSQNTGANNPGSHLVFSSNEGDSWSVYADQSLLFWVYGTVTTPGATQIESATRFTRVDVALRTGAQGDIPVQSAARLLNQPEVM